MIRIRGARSPARGESSPFASARSLAVLMLAGSIALASAIDARAEQAWVKDELKLNIRTGPGTQYRIVGMIETGDMVEILDRREGWTHVLVRGVKEGWIPVGYLQTDPPARAELARHKEEASDLQQRVKSLSSESEALRRDNESIGARDADQQAQITTLTEENMRLKVGARWPEWIAGAGLLAVGMMIGAMLHRNANRRPSPRIRL